VKLPAHTIVLSGLSVVKNVPVNYAIRSSGPVTALTARRVWYGVAPDLICQPDPPPGIPSAGAGNTISVLACLAGAYWGP
jgi:hypothetical protein